MVPHTKDELSLVFMVAPGALAAWLRWDDRRLKDGVELELDPRLANPNKYNMAVTMVLHPLVPRPVTPPGAVAMARLQVPRGLGRWAGASRLRAGGGGSTGGACCPQTRPPPSLPLPPPPRRRWPSTTCCT